MKNLFASLVCATTLTTAIAETENQYQITNLVANKPIYSPQILDDKFVNGWGIATRPAGAGGLFWVVGDKKSFQYIGDVKVSKNRFLHNLHTDDIPYVDIPTGNDEAVTTSVVFVNSQDKFIISQSTPNKKTIDKPAKFIFASDGGVISAWTEHKNNNGSFDRPTKAVTVIDESKTGAAFFGLAIDESFSRIYAANFGENPDIKVYDDQFKTVDMAFDMPFDDNKNGIVDPGEYAPFNIQALVTASGKSRLFVAYAKTMACSKEEADKNNCALGKLFPGEEDVDHSGYGRLAEFTTEGKLIKVWKDGGKLSAPWGLAFAPNDFGPFSNHLLVANFGDGTIAAYNPNTTAFSGYIQDTESNTVEIEGIWGLIFGNGASLGDKNALYFSAGPKDETDGIFGVIRHR